VRLVVLIAVLAGVLYAVVRFADWPPEQRQAMLCSLPIGLMTLAQIQECVEQQVRAALEAEMAKQRSGAAAIAAIPAEQFRQ
jgi:hypothetical protein